MTQPLLPKSARPRPRPNLSSPSPRSPSLLPRRMEKTRRSWTTTRPKTMPRRRMSKKPTSLLSRPKSSPAPSPRPPLLWPRRKTSTTRSNRILVMGASCSAQSHHQICLGKDTVEYAKYLCRKSKAITLRCGLWRHELACIWIICPLHSAPATVARGTNLASSNTESLTPGTISTARKELVGRCECCSRCCSSGVVPPVHCGTGGPGPLHPWPCEDYVTTVDQQANHSLFSSLFSPA